MQATTPVKAKTCVEPGCDGKLMARGLCNKHYLRSTKRRRSRGVTGRDGYLSWLRWVTT